MNQTETGTTPSAPELTGVRCEVVIEYHGDDGREPMIRRQGIDIVDDYLTEPALIALTMSCIQHDVILNTWITEARIKLPSRCGKSEEPCPGCGKVHPREMRGYEHTNPQGPIPTHITPVSDDRDTRGIANEIVGNIKLDHLRKGMEMAFQIFGGVLSGKLDVDSQEFMKLTTEWRENFYMTEPTVSVSELTPQGIVPIITGGVPAARMRGQLAPEPVIPDPHQFVTGQPVTVYDHMNGKCSGTVLRCDETQQKALVQCNNADTPQWYWFMQLQAC